MRSVPTLDEATELARTLAASTPNANGYDPEIKLGAWLDAWLAMKERQADTLSPSTITGYRTNIRVWKSDPIAKIRVRDLAFSNVNAALARFAEPQQRPEPRVFTDAAGRRRTRAPLHGRFVEKRSPGTLRGYQRTLHAAMEDAYRYELRATNAKNPAAGTMPAIGEAKAAKASIDRSVPLRQRIRLDKWEPSQTATFLNHVSHHRLACLWKLYATLGTRRGELAGVGWFSYDGDLMRIESRLLAQAGPHPCEFCPVDHVGVVWQPGAKRGKSIRDLILPTQLVSAIAIHRVAQEAEKAAALAAGAPWWDHELMFCQTDGSPLSPDWITDEFKRLVEECGLPMIRLHDVRHNVASMLLARGLSYASVAKLCGHDEATLKGFYDHTVREIVTPEMQAAADWMDELQAAAAEGATVTSILAKQKQTQAV
jgi:integrase